MLEPELDPEPPPPPPRAAAAAITARAGAQAAGFATLGLPPPGPHSAGAEDSRLPGHVTSESRALGGAWREEAGLPGPGTPLRRSGRWLAPEAGLAPYWRKWRGAATENPPAGAGLPTPRPAAPPAS